MSATYLGRRATPVFLAALLSVCSACNRPDPLPADGAPVPVLPAPEPIHLVDVSRAAGLNRVIQSSGNPDVNYIVDAKGTGGAWLDYDGDGDPDLYVAQGANPGRTHEGPPDRLLRNDGDPDGDGVPVFSDVTGPSGLGDRSRSFGVAVADYDNDGDPDIYLNNLGPNRLYRNEGDGTFTEIAAASGVADERWSVTACWSDTDRDGDLDLYVANYVEFDFDRYPARGETPADDTPICMWKGLVIYCGPRDLEPAADHFYRNDGDPDGDGIPTFTEATREVGLSSTERYYGLSAHFFDGDGDGDDDLYVANDSVRNNYFVNRGDGTFDDRSIVAGVAYSESGTEQAGMGISSADYDGNGLLDLVVTNFSHDHDTLYRNEGHNLFVDVSYIAGLGRPSFLTLGFGVAFIDLDHDGWEDLVVAHGHVYPQVDESELGTRFKQRNGVFHNRGDGTLEDVTERAGSGLAIERSSRALLPVDLEGDGDIDILVTNLGDALDLLRNDGAAGHWLQVGLEGRTSNRDGIGARVTVESSGRTQIREIRRNSLYAGSTLPLAHFGLGAQSSVDRVEARWPSGRVTVERNVAADRRITLIEPD